MIDQYFPVEIIVFMTQDKKASVIGAIAICIAAAMWGFDGVVLTPRLGGLHPGFIVFMVHGLPFLMMNLVFYRQYRVLPNFDKGDILTILLIALFGGAIGTLAIVKALFLVNFNKLSMIVILQKFQPVFGITLAAILLKERLQKNFALWALLAIVASYFLVFGVHLPNIHTDQNTVYAALLAFLAAFSFGSATVFGKKILLRYSFGTATFYRFGFTALIMLVYVVLTRKTGEIHNVTSFHWGIFFIIAFTTGSGAIYLYYYGLTKIRAMVATLCELTFPIASVVFDYFFNHQTLSAVQWVSALVMIAAITRISLQKEA